MSALLHPVGPEPERTYWLRRAVVLAVVLLVVAVVASVIGNLAGRQQPISAAPAPQTPSVVEPTPTPSAEVSTPTTETPSGSPTPSASATEKVKTKAKATTTPAPRPAVVPLCVPAQLRATITGRSKLGPGDDTTFQLSLINGAPVGCLVEVTAANFELKIYSGTDRIWSSRDCDTSVKPVTKRVASQQAVEWKMAWNGQRSKAGCKNRAETPKPGTYFATAQLTGAKPVQLRMILRG